MPCTVLLGVPFVRHSPQGQSCSDFIVGRVRFSAILFGDGGLCSLVPALHSGLGFSRATSTLRSELPATSFVCGRHAPNHFLIVAAGSQLRDRAGHRKGSYRI